MGLWSLFFRAGSEFSPCSTVVDTVRTLRGLLPRWDILSSYQDQVIRHKDRNYGLSLPDLAETILRADSTVPLEVPSNLHAR